MNKEIINVRFYETDLAGIVHHTNHIRWFEMGRVTFFRGTDISVDKMIARGISSPVLSVECQYKSAAKFEDVLTLITEIDKLSRIKVSFTYELTREKDGALIATGKTEHVFADIKTGKAKRIPKDIYEKMLELKK